VIELGIVLVGSYNSEACTLPRESDKEAVYWTINAKVCYIIYVNVRQLYCMYRCMYIKDLYSVCNVTMGVWQVRVKLLEGRNNRAYSHTLDDIAMNKNAK